MWCGLPVVEVGLCALEQLFACGYWGGGGLMRFCYALSIRGVLDLVCLVRLLEGRLYLGCLQELVWCCGAFAFLMLIMV